MALSNRLKTFLHQRVLGRRRDASWPFISGPYYVLDETAPVIVVMPDNNTLAGDLAALSVRGLCMVCATCRSAADIEKLTRNVEANLAIHCVVLAGGQEESYPAMEALGAIFGDSEKISDKAGVLAHKVRGKLKTFDFAALEKRVRVVNMLGTVEVDKIVAGITRLGSEGTRPNAGFVVQGDDTAEGIERVIAPNNIVHEFQTDKAGTYVIHTNKKTIILEHHNSKGEVLRQIEGTSARDLCITLIRNGWVSKLDHAAYLGRELAQAETAIRLDMPYQQHMDVPADEDAVTSGDQQ